jgi:hypothetical protein
MIACTYSLINHLKNCRNRRVVDRLKLSFNAVGQGFRFLRVRELVLPALASLVEKLETESLSS